MKIAKLTWRAARSETSCLL